MSDVITLGGPGSGHFGHAGRPGQVGGSAPASGGGLASDDPTSTPAFKTWFGNSKVVDAEGRPLVVSHGSPHLGIEVFDRLAPRNYPPKKDRMDSVGTWFTEPQDRELVASKFTGGFDDKGKPITGEIYDVYLSLQNPRVYASWDALLAEFNLVTRPSTNWRKGRVAPGVARDGGNKFHEALVKAGYDGIIVSDPNGMDFRRGEKQTYYVAFHPEQIKSVKNRGMFDPKSKLITMGGPGSGHFGHAGRPGQIGGSAPASGGGLASDVVLEKLISNGAPSVATRNTPAGQMPIPKDLREAERRLLGEKNEHGALFDADGKFVRWFGSDDPTHVTIPGGIRGQFRNGVFTHNHPSTEVTISYNDYYAASSDHVREVRAVTPLGVYAMRRVGDQPWPRLYDKNEFLPKGAPSPLEMTRRPWGKDMHAFWKRWARQHKDQIAYSFTPHPTSVEAPISGGPRGRTLGGPGSGHFGHAGRPGQIGGSAPGGGGLRSDVIDPIAARVVTNNIEQDIYRQVAFLHDNANTLDDVDLTRLPENATIDDIAKLMRGAVLTDHDSARARVEAHAQAIFAEAHVAVRVKEETLANILADERLRTQFETGTSGGDLDPEARARVEAQLFGIPPDQKDKRPIYGFAFSDIEADHLAGDQPRGHNIGRYGDVSLVLHDSVKSRTTLTSGDTLNEFDTVFRQQRAKRHRGESPEEIRFVPTPMESPASAHLGIDLFHNRNFLSARTIDEVTGQNGTVETQVLGGVALKDIARVVVHYNPRTFPKINSDTLIGFVKKGVTVEIRAHRGQVIPEEHRQFIKQWLVPDGVKLIGGTYLSPPLGSIRGVIGKPRTLGGPGSGHFGHAGRPGQIGGSAPANGGGLASDGDDPHATVTLYRGDASDVSHSLDHSDPLAAFGAGIYLTDSKRIANDYQAKGARSLFVTEGMTKAESIEAYKRRVLAPWLDEHGKPLSSPEALKGTPKSNDAKRLAHAEREWERTKDNIDIRKRADGTVVFREKTQLGHTSAFHVPKTWLAKALDAEQEIPQEVAAVLHAAMRRQTPRLAEDLYNRAMQKDSNGFRPTFREIWQEAAMVSAGNWGSDSGLVSPKGMLELRREFKRLGYKGIKYAGGVTMGGRKHTAYVFWDEQGLKKLRVAGGPGSGHFGHAGRPGQVGGSAPGRGGALASDGAVSDGSPSTPTQWSRSGQVENWTREFPPPSIEDMENWIAHEGYEIGGLFDDDTGEFVQAFCSDNPNGIKLPYQIGLYANKVFTHNHPSVNVTLSNDDFNAAQKFNFREIRAVTDKGVYRLRRTGERWPARLDIPVAGVPVDAKPEQWMSYAQLAHNHWLKYAAAWPGKVVYEFIPRPRVARERRAAGGPGSGHFGHAGRPGQIGGSAPANGGALGSDQEFSSRDVADAWGARTQQWAKVMSSEEERSLFFYTHYVGLNDALRRNRPPSDLETNRVLGESFSQARSLRGLDTLFARPETALPEDVIVHRMWHGQAVAHKPVGAEFIDRGFTSTALVQSELHPFKLYDKQLKRGIQQSVGINVTIRVPKGTHALYVGVKAPGREWFAGNTELLLRRGTRFRVVSTDARDGIEARNVVLEVVPR